MEDGQRIVDAFTALLGKSFKVRKASSVVDTVEIITPFLSTDSTFITLYAYRGAGNKLYLSDCRQVVDSLNHVPIVGPNVSVNMKLLQDLLGTYGLTLTQGGAVIETSSLKLGIRVLNLISGRIAVDGLLRLWSQNQPTARTQGATAA